MQLHVICGYSTFNFDKILNNFAPTPFNLQMIPKVSNFIFQILEITAYQIKFSKIHLLLLLSLRRFSTFRYAYQNIYRNFVRILKSCTSTVLVQHSVCCARKWLCQVFNIRSLVLGKNGVLLKNKEISSYLQHDVRPLSLIRFSTCYDALSKFSPSRCSAQEDQGRSDKLIINLLFRIKSYNLIILAHAKCSDS